MAQATCPGAAGVDGVDAGTEHSGQEETRDGRGEVERVEGGKEPAGMDSGAASRNCGGLRPVEYGSGSTYSQHPLPVAVQKRWGLCSLAHPHYWVLRGPTEVGGEGSCYSQQQPEVVVWDTNKMEYEKGYLVKKSPAAEVAEVAEADIDRTWVDSCSLSWTPARGRGVVDAEGVERIGRKLLQACCTVDSSQWHRGRRGHSVAAEAVHKGHNHPRDSGAEVDTVGSESNNGHIDEDAEARVGDAEVGARMTGTAYDMEVEVVDA